MKDTHLGVWPDAKAALSAKYAENGVVPLWYRDNELEFTVTSIRRNYTDGVPVGDRFELACTTEKVTAVIFTRDDSDKIDLSFISTG